MNIFQELKEKKDVLTKDGKVDALGPYGRQKLTGQEVAQYFKKNKVKDSKVKKAVEVALDLGGAMSVATKEIKKFFGNKILRSKEVQSALKYANESFEMNQLVGMLHEDVNNLTEKSLIPDLQKIVDTKGAAKVGGVMVDMFTASMITQIYDKVNDNNKKKMDKSKIEVLVNLAQKMMQKMEYDPSDIVEGRAMKPKQIAKKYKREIEQLAKKGQSPEMGRHKVYMALYNLAWENGDINTDDPDQTDEVIDEYLDDIMGEFFAHLESVKEGFKSELVEGKGLKFTKVKDKSLEKHLKVVTKKVGAKLEKISGGFAVSDTDMRGFTAVVDYIMDKSIKKEPFFLANPTFGVNMVSESKDVRKKYKGKEQKSVDKLIMQKGVDKVQQFHDKNPKEFDKMVKNLAMMEEVLDENEEGLKNKAEKSGMPLGILKQVYNRGLAAYKTGHRPGATAPQWAMARVNSFVTKSKGTWGGADKDLAAKVKGKSESVELQQIGELSETLSQVHNLTEKPYDDKDVKNVEKLEKKLEKMLKEVDKTMRGSGLSAPAFSMVRSGIVKGLESIKKFYKIANNTKSESNIMDTYRQMWEDTIVEKKEMNPKVIEKIAKLTDRNDHNESLLLLAKELRDKEAVKLLGNIKDMHKVYGHMPQELIGLRNAIYDNLMRQSKDKFDNHKDVYGAL